MESGSLFNLDNLTHLGQRAGVDMRPTLIRVLTDLYVQKLTHTPDEERHYTELAMRLLDAVDVTTRTAVATRLSRHLSPPLQVMQRLAADLPSVAAPLRKHALLQDPQKAKAPETPAVAVARIAMPARQKEKAPRIVEPAAEQQRRPSADLTAPIAADIAAELNELFFAADAVERRLILLNLEVAVPSPAGRISLPRDAAVALRLERAILARDHADFAQHLTEALQIPPMQARRIASDELGEPIVIVAKALQMSREVVYRLLLFVNTAVGHSVERVHALANLYDDMTTQTAEHMVAIWQALQKQAHRIERQEDGNDERKADRQAAQYHPLYWNDEARARARTASATVRRAPAGRRSADRRDVS